MGPTLNNPMSFSEGKSEKLLYKTKIKNWPEDERPREKLLDFGSNVLSDAELLALLIGSGTKELTAVDLAKGLILEYGGLSVLASKGPAELIRFKGVGPASSARILAAFELGRRLEGKQCKRKQIRTPEDVVAFARPVYRGVNREMFKVVLLDNSNKVIREETISQGTLNASLVHPREVFKAAVDHLAAGIVLLHNHPSGEPSPSREDKLLTGQMIEASKVMGIPILDHIIIAKERYFSFAKEGLIKI